MVLILIPILIAMSYHGFWNLSEAGSLWWENNLTQFSNEFRIFTGVLELIIFASLFNRFSRKYACFIGFSVMLSATIIQLNNGYSYKFGGFEVPLTYSFMFLYLFIKSRKSRSISLNFWRITHII